MARLASDHSRLRVLISNDDGVDSPGIELLERLVRQVTDDVWVCAPASEQSACSHSLTLLRPVTLAQHGERRFSVTGTPADCVLMGVYHLLGERRPDLVVSGINCGRNIGDDISYSGTVAAAKEATMLGIPAIAFSQQVRDWKRGPNWNVAEHHLPAVLTQLLNLDFPSRVLINVNFPDVALQEVKMPRVVRQGIHEVDDLQYIRQDDSDPTAFWVGAAPRNREGTIDSDIGVLFDGGISVTPIGLDLTEHASLNTLRAAFA